MLLCHTSYSTAGSHALGCCLAQPPHAPQQTRNVVLLQQSGCIMCCVCIMCCRLQSVAAATSDLKAGLLGGRPPGSKCPLLLPLAGEQQRPAPQAALALLAGNVLLQRRPCRSQDALAGSGASCSSLQQ